MQFEDTNQDQPLPVGDATIQPLAEAPEDLPRSEEPRPIEGEVIEPPRTAGYAHDGNLIPAAADTTGQFLDLLEEGAFSIQLAGQSQALVREMVELSRLTGKSQKGKIQITLDLECEGQTFKIAPTAKVTPPKVNRPRSTLFVDDHHRFTRFPPGQNQMFGMPRQAGGSGGIRRP